MNIITTICLILCVINIALGIFCFVPCVAAAAMSLDSPSAQKDWKAVTGCYLIMSFPLVCIACGILSGILAIFKSTVGFGILLGILPYIEVAIVVILAMLL